MFVFFNVFLFCLLLWFSWHLLRKINRIMREVLNARINDYTIVIYKRSVCINILCPIHRCFYLLIPLNSESFPHLHINIKSIRKICKNNFKSIYNSGNYHFQNAFLRIFVVLKYKTNSNIWFLEVILVFIDSISSDAAGVFIMSLTKSCIKTIPSLSEIELSSWN